MPPTPPIPAAADLTAEQWARLLWVVFGPPRLIYLPRRPGLLTGRLAALAAWRLGSVRLRLL